MSNETGFDVESWVKNAYVKKTVITSRQPLRRLGTPNDAYSCSRWGEGKYECSMRTRDDEIEEWGEVFGEFDDIIFTGNVLVRASTGGVDSLWINIGKGHAYEGSVFFEHDDAECEEIGLRSDLGLHPVTRKPVIVDRKVMWCRV